MIPGRSWTRRCCVRVPRAPRAACRFASATTCRSVPPLTNRIGHQRPEHLPQWHTTTPQWFHLHCVQRVRRASGRLQADCAGTRFRLHPRAEPAAPRPQNGRAASDTGKVRPVAADAQCQSFRRLESVHAMRSQCRATPRIQRRAMRCDMLTPVSLVAFSTVRRQAQRVPELSDARPAATRSPPLAHRFD